jgi:histidine triad (HIT) family protein
MTDCLFCKIAAGEIPADIVYQDEQMVAFKDIAPKAKVHLLLIPRKHIESLIDQSPEDAPLIGAMMAKIPELAKQAGLDEGFRVVANSGPGGGQEVPHLHFHILGDVRDTQWKGF